MKRQIRQNVFETNSSSVHSLTICSEEDFKKWENGELAYDKVDEILVPLTNDVLESMKKYKNYKTYGIYLTREDFDEYTYDYKMYEQHEVLDTGEKIVAFGYYGYN